MYIILFSKDVTVITYNNCNLSILWLRVTYPVSNSASQVSVTNVLGVCCSFAWCVVCVYIGFLCKNYKIFIMSAEEEVLRIQKKLNKMSSGDGTVSKWVKYSCVSCSAYWRLNKALFQYYKVRLYCVNVNKYESIIIRIFFEKINVYSYEYFIDTNNWY